MSSATVIMISSLLKDSSDDLDAVPSRIIRRSQVKYQNYTIKDDRIGIRI